MFKYDDRLRCRITFLVRYYDDFKEFFKVDKLKQQIKKLTEQNEIQSEAIKELEQGLEYIDGENNG